MLKNNKMIDYKYVIFDFDMTLVDTSNGSALCYQNAFEATGGRFDIHDLSIYMGEFLDKTYLRIKSPLLGYDDFEKIFYDNSHKYMARMSKLYDDTVVCLKELSKTKKLSIVTNKDRKCVEQILQFHKIKLNLFETIICCDDVSNKKPHPEGLNKCINSLNCDKKQCVYIGDNSVDVEFAYNAGIESLRINRDFNTTLMNNEIRALTDLI